MTIEERSKLFMKELEELLEKHKCTIDLEEKGHPYREYEVMVLNFDAEYDDDGNRISEDGEYTLGSHLG